MTISYRDIPVFAKMVTSYIAEFFARSSDDVIVQTAEEAIQGIVSGEYGDEFHINEFVTVGEFKKNVPDVTTSSSAIAMITGIVASVAHDTYIDVANGRLRRAIAFKLMTGVVKLEEVTGARPDHTSDKTWTVTTQVSIEELSSEMILAIDEGIRRRIDIDCDRTILNRVLALYPNAKFGEEDTAKSYILDITAKAQAANAARTH